MKKSARKLADELHEFLFSHTGKNWLSDADRDTIKQTIDVLRDSDDPLGFLRMFSFPQESPIIVAEYDDAAKVMTVHRADGNITKFHGSSTVWHKMPMMERCSTIMDKTLSGLYTYITKWKGPYPVAHIQKSSTEPHQDRV